MLLLLVNMPAAAQPGYANLSLSLDDLWYPLNAAGQADAIFWTPEQLVAYMDEALKRYARVTGAFVERDESIIVSAGQGSYNLPARHIDTIQCDLAGRTLRPRSVQNLEALNSDWPDELAISTNLPQAFVQNTQGFDKIVIYPKPYLDPETVGLVRSTYPATLDAAASLIVPIPPIVRDYFTFSALAGARSEEGHGAMNEVVPWLRSITGLYEQVGGELWGTSLA